MDTLERILNLMLTNEIPQNELAEKIGVNTSTISDWKNGKTKSYMKYLDRLASYFDVSVDYLLCKTDTKSNDIDIALICKKTGLSEKIINTLVLLQESKHLREELHEVETEDDIHQHYMERPSDIDVLNIILEELLYTAIIQNTKDLIYFAKRTNTNIVEEMESEDKKVEFLINFPNIYNELKTNNLYILTEYKMKQNYKNSLSLSFSNFVERLSHSQYHDEISKYYHSVSQYEERDIKSHNEELRKRIKEAKTQPTNNHKGE